MLVDDSPWNLTDAGSSPPAPPEDICTNKQTSPQSWSFYMSRVYTRNMQKDVVYSVEMSWAILMFLGGVMVAVLIMVAARSALLPPRDASSIEISSLLQDTIQSGTSSKARHVVIPPVLGDAVLGSQNVCGCPGCCSVLNS